MKLIRLLSVFLAFVSIVLAYYSFENTVSRTSITTSIPTDFTELVSVNKSIENAVETINLAANDISTDLKETNINKNNKDESSPASATAGDSEREYINEEFQVLREEIEKIKLANDSLLQPEQTPTPDFYSVFSIKLGFSLLFGLSALFVILSKRYKEDTEKWAFSVLSLISGVWIGTIP